MGEHVHINTELKVIYYPDTKAQLTREDIVMIFGEPEAVDRCMEFSASLQKLRLTYEEVAVLKAIIITFRGTLIKACSMCVLYIIRTLFCRAMFMYDTDLSMLSVSLCVFFVMSELFLNLTSDECM